MKGKPSDLARNIYAEDVYMLANHAGETAWRAMIDGSDGYGLPIEEPKNMPGDDDEIMQWFFVSPYLAGLFEDAGETILEVNDGFLWGRRGYGYAVTDDIERALREAGVAE